MEAGIVTEVPALGGHRPALALLGRIANGDDRFFPWSDAPEARAEHAEITLVLERLAAWGLVTVASQVLSFPRASAGGLAAELTDRGRLYASLLPPIHVLTDRDGRRWAYWEEGPSEQVAPAGQVIVYFCAGRCVRPAAASPGATEDPETVAGLWAAVR